MPRNVPWRYRLDDLFRAFAEVEVAGAKVYLRLLSDLDLQTREVQAAAAEAEARRAFTPERARAAISFMARPQLVEVVLGRRAQELARQAQEAYPPVFIPIPDGADHAERVEALERRRQAEEETARQRLRWYEEQLRAERERLEALPQGELEALALEATAEAYARAAYGRAYERWTLYLAAFKDPEFRERLWSEPEEVDRVPQGIRARLMEAYVGLEAYDPFHPDGDGPGRGGPADF